MIIISIYVSVFDDSDSFGILFGYGNGSFSNMIIYSIERGSHPMGIAAADLNNDTYIDIIVTNTEFDSIGVFLGYGNGSFVPMRTYSTGNNSNPIDVIVDDCNNDHQLDIIVINSDGDNMGILLGYGNGHFSSIRTTFLGQRL